MITAQQARDKKIDPELNLERLKHYISCEIKLYIELRDSVEVIIDDINSQFIYDPKIIDVLKDLGYKVYVSETRNSLTNKTRISINIDWSK